MTDTKPAKRSIKDLGPAKAVANTSIGDLFVRHLRADDAYLLDIEDRVAQGAAIVQRLSSRMPDKTDTSPLPNPDYAALQPADFELLSRAIAKQCGYQAELDPPFPEALGTALRDQKLAQFESNRRVLESLKNPPLEFTPVWQPPPFHETPSGMAALRTAAGVEISVDIAKETNAGTKRNFWITLIISILAIIVSVVIAVWQMNVTKALDADNGKQQKAIEQLQHELVNLQRQSVTQREQEVSVIRADMHALQSRLEKLEKNTAPAAVSKK